MYAAVLHEFGPPENLHYELTGDPEPGSGQVRIAVRAAGVHLVDTTIRRGEPGPFPSPELPEIGGREVAGVVDRVGADVDPFWLGRPVVAHLGMAGAGYAELAVVATTSLHELPSGADRSVPDDDFAAAVAMIGTGRTAMAILECAELTVDDVVLVTSAAGGLGTLLVQAASNVGATVVAAAGGPAKVEHANKLGATLAVDYDNEHWPAPVTDEFGERPISLVLDGIGGTRGRAALELLQPGGRIVFYGWSSGEPTSISVFDLVGRGITATAAIGPILTKRAGGLRGFEEQALSEWTAGRLIPAMTTFPLAEAARAHAALENRETTGKVVLIP